MFMVSWTELPSFWHFFFRQLNGYFLLLAFAQDSERHVRSFRKTADELGKLVWIDQDLIIQHFDDVVLLHASRGCRAIWHNVVNDQSKAFRQAQLLAHNARHFGRLDA